MEDSACCALLIAEESSVEKKASQCLCNHKEQHQRVLAIAYSRRKSSKISKG